jgi:sedoheptulokinase
MKCIGIDVGTTSVASALIDLSDGTVRKTVSKRHCADIEPRNGFEHTQDPATILRTSQEVLAEMAHGESIQAIGVTGQMHGLLYLNQEGRATGPIHTWLDQRAKRRAASGEPIVELLRKRTGRSIPAGYAAATHFANGCLGLIPEDAVQLCTPPDYIAMTLCRLTTPVTDTSLAHSMGLFDWATGAFDMALWRQLDPNPMQLPVVQTAKDIVGHTADGVAVTTPIGDNQASFVGTVGDPTRTALFNVGTSGQLSLIQGNTSVSQEWEVEVRPYPEDRRLLVGASLTGGKAIDVLAGLISEVDVAINGTQSCNPYALLDFGAGAVSEPFLTAETQFAGTRRDANAAGRISNIRLDNFDLKHLAHSFAHGIVDELLSTFGLSSRDDMALAGIDQFVGSGNTVRRFSLLRRAFSERTKHRLLLPLHAEEAAVGAAVLAAATVANRRTEDIAAQVISYETPE